MRNSATELWARLERGSHLYVCGDASRMAQDVDRALHKIIAQAGLRDDEAATAYINKMRKDKRYVRDVY